MFLKLSLCFRDKMKINVTDWPNKLEPRPDLWCQTTEKLLEKLEQFLKDRKAGKTAKNGHREKCLKLEIAHYFLWLNALDAVKLENVTEEDCNELMLHLAGMTRIGKLMKKLTKLSVFDEPFSIYEMKQF